MLKCPECCKSFACIRIACSCRPARLYVCVYKNRNEWSRSKKCAKKEPAKFIVCYFQVSFWCRTVEYCVTVICDWVLFHSNLIYINSSSAHSIRYGWVWSIIPKNSTQLLPELFFFFSILLHQSFVRTHSLYLIVLSNPCCIAFRISTDNIK